MITAEERIEEDRVARERVDGLMEKASTVLSEIDKIADDGGEEVNCDSHQMLYLKQNHNDKIKWKNISLRDIQAGIKPIYGTYRGIKIYYNKGAN